MGTKDPNIANRPLRPATTSSTSPQYTMPFSSSHPVFGHEASTIRPPHSPAAQTMTPVLFSGPVVGTDASSALRPSWPPASQTGAPLLSSRPVVGSEVSGFGPIPQSWPTASSMNPPAASYGPQGAGNFQRFQAPQFPSAAQLPPPSTPPMGQPAFPPPTKHPFGHVSSESSFQSLPPSIPMGSPPQSISSPPSNTKFSQPSVDSSYFAPRPHFQQSPPSTRSSYPAAQGNLPSAFPGYAGMQHTASTVAPPGQSSALLIHQGGYVQPSPRGPTPFSPQGGYSARTSIPAPGGLYSREQMRPSGSLPAISSSKVLSEDFSSLSLRSAPGSLDPIINSQSLPRPLDGDPELRFFTESYPMNCNSRYLRLTTSAIPNSQSLFSRWHLPLGVVVCPLAEAPIDDVVPIVNYAPMGIIRCRRCRTYVNPYVTFTDGGRKWQCNICPMLNEVPGDYFAPLDAGGRRIDLDQRPELNKGSVEFVAPTEYMVRPPMPPVYVFLIDVSVFAVRSGMLEVVAQTIKSCLDKLPGNLRAQIGFITFDSTIHFYNMKSSLTQPQMMVVSDLDDIFVPLPDDLLVNLSESRGVVDAFLDSLPALFQDNFNVESAFGPALKASLMIMNQLGGKLLIFQNTLPSLGVGHLKLRGDDLRVYGTDKEHALRIPDDPFYKQMAADFTKYQISVNLYAFSDKYTDIASLGTLAKYTGGQVYYYPSFQSVIHKERLQYELARDLTRETAWEAVLRIRCGRGVRFTSYHGNFMLRSTDLIALPAVDCDKAYAAQFCLEETSLTSPTMYFQVALLYTSSSGERRIRVHTAAVPVVGDLGEMYQQADTSAIVSLLSRLAIEKSLSCKLEEVRNSIQPRIVKALREYRNLYAVQHQLGSRMIYPESLKFLPLYGLALCKSTPLRGGFADAQLDERCAAGYTIMALPVKKLLKLLYPNLIRLDEYLLKADELENIVQRVPLAAESLDSRGLYVYDDGFRFVIWFGQMLSPDITKNLLGEDFATDYSKVSLYEHQNDMSKNLMRILQRVREADPSYYQLCQLVRQGEQPRESFSLLSNLVEDQVGGMNGYLEWITQIHRQTQQKA